MKPALSLREIERRLSIVALMALQDPPDIRRRHVLTRPGKYGRDVSVLFPLLRRWAVQRAVARDPGSARVRGRSVVDFRRRA